MTKQNCSAKNAGTHRAGFGTTAFDAATGLVFFPARHAVAKVAIKGCDEAKIARTDIRHARPCLHLWMRKAA
jgi:hypothetical protein